jgi:hypothetical protein
MTEVQILNKKYTRPVKLDALRREGWHVVDVTSTSPDETYRKFSPFYPHGGIEVGKYTSESVEGLWQGLKVFSDHGVDESKFKITLMKNLKRSGAPLGHQSPTAVPGELLGYVEARKAIFLPAYSQVLERMQDTLSQLRGNHPRIIFLDYETNEDIHDIRKPLSHASLIKQWLAPAY